MRGEDEHKDEIKRSAREEKQPKQGRGEGDERYFILLLKFREREEIHSALSNP